MANTEGIPSKMLRTLLFRGNFIYLPTVLLFWYFATVLLLVPLLRLSPRGISDFHLTYLSFGYLIAFLAENSPLDNLLKLLGIAQLGGWWTDPDPLGLLIIFFSLFLLVVFLINFVLGKFLLSLFKVRRSKSEK